MNDAEVFTYRTGWRRRPGTGLSIPCRRLAKRKIYSRLHGL